MSSPFVFTRLYIPRPIETDTVRQLLVRIAASDVPRPLAFEIRADDGGIQHVLGCAPTAVHMLKHLLAHAFPDIIFDTATRSPVASSGRISTSHRGLTLGTPNPEDVLSSLYGTLAARKAGETLVLQAILGRSRSPEPVHPEVPDPLQPISSRLWNGTKKASTETRRRLQAHASDIRLAGTLRIGIDGPDSRRRAALAHALFGSLQPLQSAGVRLRLAREAASAVHAASAAKPGFQVTPEELVPLLGLPVGHGEFPGVQRLHPKRIPVPKAVSRSEAVFAVGTTPGPERLVGLTADARLSHISVMAPTGSGKSEAVLTPLLLADIAAGRPVVLVDPKGQLVEYILDCLGPEVADRLEVFNPADPEGTARFNPLDARGRDAYAVVDSCMAVFKAVFSDGWGPRTEDILHAALLTLAINGQHRDKPHTILDIPKLLTDDSFRRGVVGAVSAEAEIARFWARYESLSSAQREHEIAAPMNKLRRYLMRRGVTAVLGDPDPAFHLRNIWKSDKIVLVALNDALSGVQTSQLVGGFICAEAFMAAQERATEKDPKSKPGFVYVDEVRKLLHLPIPIGEALEICRSFGVGWALFGQGFYQLGTDLADAVGENTKSKITFAAGAKEARLIARQTTQFSAEDVLELPKYEVYANLLTAHGSSGWFSARTLPPPTRLGHGTTLLAAARQRYRLPAEPPPSNSSLVVTAEQQTPEPSSTHLKRRRP